MVGCAVTGGSVYRGPIPELWGLYFFADFCASRLWSLRFDGSAPQDHDGTNFTELADWTDDPRFTPDAGSFDSITSFGEDDDGNLYIVDLDGEIFRVPQAPSAALLAAALGVLALLHSGTRRTVWSTRGRLTGLRRSARRVRVSAR